MWTATLTTAALVFSFVAPQAAQQPATLAAAADAADEAQVQVRWHASADLARTAARASGKPVLVFQLLGNLDDDLC